MKRGPSLFDALEIEEDRNAPECPHRVERKTLTVWKGENWERLTWTCEACNRVRGRVDNR